MNQNSLNILIVDSDPATADELQSILVASGDEVSGWASTGSEALSLAPELKPELAFVDLNLTGELNGVQTAEDLSREHPSLEFVFITDPTNDPALIQEASKLKPIGLLIKPYTQKTVNAVLENVSPRHKSVKRVDLRSEALIEAINSAILLVDDQGVILDLNASALNLLGYERNELVGEKVEILVPKRFQKVHTTQRAEYAKHPQARRMGQGMDLEAVRKDGQSIPVQILISPVKSRSRTVTLVNLVDMTHQKQVEATLRKNEMKYRSLVESTRNIIFSIDVEGHWTFLNNAAEAIYGLPTDDLLGRCFFEFSCPTSVQDDIHAINRLGQGENLDNYETRHLRQDGSVVDIQVSATVIRTTDGRIEGAIGIISDITEQLQKEAHKDELEVQLRQAQKLEAVGQLAAGIAHEINTPIQYIGDNLRFLQGANEDLKQVTEALHKLRDAIEKKATPDELNEAANESKAIEDEVDLEFLTDELPSAIEQSLHGVDRVTKIVRAMRDFSHPGQVETKPVDIHNLIESTSVVSMNSWKYVAELNKQFDPQMPLVPCLANEINQILLNLIVNAAHAIEERIGNNPGKDDKGIITISTHHKAGWAEIHIQDNGTGIPADVQRRMFDPFYTTKELGKGTGQGLAIVQSVMQKHGGTVSCETEIGKGTTFVLRLPLEEGGST